MLDSSWFDSLRVNTLSVLNYQVFCAKIDESTDDAVREILRDLVVRRIAVEKRLKQALRSEFGLSDSGEPLSLERIFAADQTRRQEEELLANLEMLSPEDARAFAKDSYQLVMKQEGVAACADPTSMNS